MVHVSDEDTISFRGCWMEVSQCVVFGVSGDVSGLWDELDWAPAGVSLRKEGFGASPNGGGA